MKADCNENIRKVLVLGNSSSECELTIGSKSSLVVHKKQEGLLRVAKFGPWRSNTTKEKQAFNNCFLWRFPSTCASPGMLALQLAVFQPGWSLGRTDQEF